MLLAHLGAAGSGLGRAIFSAFLASSRDLCLTASRLACQAAGLGCQNSYHTKAQDIASSCRIPSPIVPEVCGKVHLREGLTTVDGPGLRYLVVLPSGTNPGCDLSEGTPVSSKAVANELCHLRPYLLEHDGGVSIANHLLDQQDFCVSVFKEAHALNLTTCLQTTIHGAADGDLDPVLEHTDIVGLDVRPMHSPSDILNGNKEWRMDEIAQLSHRLHELRIPHFLRYVLVPGMTDQPHDINMLMEVSKLMKPHLQGIQLLPYHVLGGTRWQWMGYGQPSKGKIQPFKIEAVNNLVKQMNEHGFDVSLNLKTA